jgi:spoIIIJ-associated protein
VEWVEVTAKTVEDAKDKALDYLGVDESQAEFEILEEPRRGLLGRMKGDARVRARVKPSHPRPKAERRDRRRGRKREEGERATGSERSGSRRTGSGGAREGGSATPTRPRSGGGRGASSGPGGDSGPAEPEVQVVDQPVASPSGGEEEAAAADGPDRARRRRRRPTGDTSGAREARVDDAPSSTEVDEVSLAKELEAAEQFLSGLVGAFGFEATVQRGRSDDEVQELAVTGEDLGLLIGPKGSTLEAVQELTRLAARRQVEGRAEARIRVDVAGYRERRRAALERFVRGLAEEVVATGSQKALEPMSSPDRKVVHDTVATLEGVATLSEGEEPNRRVVIIPA